VRLPRPAEFGPPDLGGRLAEGVEDDVGIKERVLSFIDLFAIEFEIRRKGPLHLAELLKRFGNRSGKTHGQTVVPL
jgi:hypothetical protein